MNTVKFKTWECEVKFSHYPHNMQRAILLVDATTGEPIAKATVCLEYAFGADQTAIKSYSENEGMLEALISAGIVEDTGLRLSSDFVSDIALVDILFDEDSYRLDEKCKSCGEFTDDCCCVPDEFQCSNCDNMFGADECAGDIEKGFGLCYHCNDILKAEYDAELAQDHRERVRDMNSGSY